MHEMTHQNRGSGVRQLIKESPDDIQNVMKKVLEEPNNAKTFLRETDNIRWKKWGDGQFFKHYTSVGKKFETNVVNDGLRIRNQNAGSTYRQIKDKIMALTTPTPPPVLPGKNIDDYELFTGLQLNIKNTGNYFVADQVFVKFAVNSKGKRYISDMIIMESKLTDATKLSTRQGEAFTYKNGGFSARTKLPKSIYNDAEDFNTALKEIHVEPTFIKCFDGTDGNAIEDLKIISNINS